MTLGIVDEVTLFVRIYLPHFINLLLTPSSLIFPPAMDMAKIFEDDHVSKGVSLSWPLDRYL